MRVAFLVATWALISSAVDVLEDATNGALLLQVERGRGGSLRWTAWNDSVDWSLGRSVRIRGVSELSCMVEGRSCPGGRHHAHTLVLANKSTDEMESLLGLSWAVDCAPAHALTVHYAYGPILDWLKPRTEEPARKQEPVRRESRSWLSQYWWAIIMAAMVLLQLLAPRTEPAQPDAKRKKNAS
jgi:hypothetical protein